MTEIEENDILIPLLSALCIHLVFFLVISGAINNYKTTALKTQSVQKSLPLRIEKISRQEMKKYRTVGKRNGSKKKFSMPIKGGPNLKRNAQKKPKIKVLSEKRTKLQDALSFKALMPTDKLNINKFKRYKRDLDVSKNSGIKLPEMNKKATQSRERQKVLKKNLLQQLGPGSVNAKLANKSDFQIHFETPEGVNEDELNSAEKKYYSFQKRTFESYFHSFLKSYNKRLRSHPQVKYPLQTEQHSLTGRVTFDENGNIVSIKILKWSKSDEIQELFEDTLKEIRSLPNPPKALLQKDTKEFNIYYQLQIN